MWVEEGSDWRARVGVPNDEHRILTAVRGYDPSFVLGAGSCSDLIAMTLQQLLSLLLIIVDDTRMSSTVEDLRPLISGKVVRTLIDILVKTKNPLEIQGSNTITLFLLRDLMAIVVHVKLFCII